jgi:hypothetical protein
MINSINNRDSQPLQPYFTDREELIHATINFVGCKVGTPISAPLQWDGLLLSARRSVGDCADLIFGHIGGSCLHRNEVTCPKCFGNLQIGLLLLFVRLRDFRFCSPSAESKTGPLLRGF